MKPMAAEATECGAGTAPGSRTRSEARALPKVVLLSDPTSLSFLMDLNMRMATMRKNSPRPKAPPCPEMMVAHRTHLFSCRARQGRCE